MIIKINSKIQKITDRTHDPKYPKCSILVALDDWATKLSIEYSGHTTFKVGDWLSGLVDINAITGNSKSDGRYYEMVKITPLDIKTSSAAIPDAGEASTKEESMYLDTAKNATEEPVTFNGDDIPF